MLSALQILLFFFLLFIDFIMLVCGSLTILNCRAENETASYSRYSSISVAFNIIDLLLKLCILHLF